MAGDLGPTPTSGLTVQLCGDAHLSNFGGFASPERDLVFDINDFDETAPRPVRVGRQPAGRELRRRRPRPRHGRRGRKAAVRACMGEYRRAMHEFAGMRDLELWYARMDAAGVEAAGARRSRPGRQGVQEDGREGQEQGQPARDVEADAEHRRRGAVREPAAADRPAARAVDNPADGERALEEVQATDPRLSVEPALDRRHLLDGYRSPTWRARWSASAASAPGPGSSCCSAGTTATRCSCRSRRPDLGARAGRGAQPVAHQGRRVVEGQRLMQAASDIFLGWYRRRARRQERDFYVRQLWDLKGSAVVEG